MSDDDYYVIRTDNLSDIPSRSRPRPLRAALLFASAAIALTVLVAPEVRDRVESRQLAAMETPMAIDDTATGAIMPRRVNLDGFRLRSGREASGNPGRTRSTYILRRSVLSEGSVCVIRQDGSRSGAC